MPVSDKVQPEEIELHLLIETDEKTVRLRHREAAFVSIVIHFVAVIFLLLEPSIFRSVVDSVPAENARLPEHLTYLALPPDDQVAKVRPKTDIASDKDRIAQPGLPYIPAPRLPPLPPPRPPVRSENRPAEAEQEALAQTPPPAVQPPPENATQGINKLLAPPAPVNPPTALQDVAKNPPQPPQLPASSPGRTLEEVMRGVARERAAGGGGPIVTDPGSPGAQRQAGVVGQAQILSDTMGVDFNPYLQRIVVSIRLNWYAVMPEIARMGKKGQVVVDFEIQRDGMVPKLFLVTNSGSEPLDRAALAAISASVPFLPLPAEFKGPLVRLQVTFLYNRGPQQ